MRVIGSRDSVNRRTDSAVDYFTLTSGEGGRKEKRERERKREGERKSERENTGEKQRER